MGAATLRRAHVTPFAYRRPRSLGEAAAALRKTPDAGLLSGGTCLLDLMKQGVLTPSAVVDLNFVPELKRVDVAPDGALEIAGATPLSHVARDPRVRAGWPLLHEAIVDGLTPQLRNAASVAGNVMQRPRCIYFREPGFACNKKVAGSGCAAQAGVHYSHALFGGAAARSCIAVHPSDLCVALTAMEAEVDLLGTEGERTLPIAELHRLPGDDPTRETTLRPGELVIALRVPAQGARGGAYVKGSEGFTLASCAALVGVRDATITSVRLVFGGVAHAPWRSHPAEAALLGLQPGTQAIARAQDVALGEAQPDRQTSFRVKLLRAVIAEALERAFDQAAA